MRQRCQLEMLQKKSPDCRMWVFYWILYALDTYSLYFSEWIIYLHFGVLVFYIDGYYEAQVANVFFLLIKSRRSFSKCLVVMAVGVWLSELLSIAAPLKGLTAGARPMCCPDACSAPTAL